MGPVTFKKDCDKCTLQPIETAPKDGTPILLFIEGGFIEGYYCEITASYDPNDAWETHNISSHGCGCCATKIDPPTHWMPLPTLEEK